MTISDQISTWLRERLTGASADGFVAGLSGGVDSATSAALAVRAVGPERVLAALMPCHSQPEDAALGQLVADTFSMPTVTVDLSGAYDALMAALPPSGHPLASATAPPADEDPLLPGPGPHLPGAGLRQPDGDRSRVLHKTWRWGGGPATPGQSLQDPGVGTGPRTGCAAAGH